MEASMAKPIAEPRRRGIPGPDLAVVGTLVVVAWLPVLVGVTTRPLLGWASAVLIAVVVERATARLHPRVLVGALVVAGALVPSGLVTDSTHYLPVAATAGALAIRAGLKAWSDRRLERPAVEPLVLATAAYLGWAALAAITAIDHRTSAAYWVGMVAVCGLMFWVIPLLVARREDREFILLVMGALGVLVASSVYVLSPMGAITLFGRRISDYQLIDLTLGGRPTGFHFGKSAGLFLSPLEPSVLMVMAILALIGWSAMRSGWWTRAGRIAIAFVAGAIVITLDRSAWLAAIVGAGVFAALPIARRPASLTAAVVCLFFAVVFFAVVANAVGANAVATACTTGCTQAAPGSDEAPVRGGTGLSDRDLLWKASLHAIAARPILGYGPGNNVPAIAPWLASGPGLVLKGLTSHDTWLRTGVEEGIPGLGLLLVVFGVALWVFLRGPRKERDPADRRTGIPDPTRITFAVSVLGLLAVMTFESFFLGGVNYSNLYLALAIALMLPNMTLAQFRRSATQRISLPESS